MRVESFVDQWGAAAEILGVGEGVVRAEFASEPDVIGRWIALDGATGLGLVTVWTRADGRSFLRFRVLEDSAHGPLAAAAMVVGLPLSATFLATQEEQIAALIAEGFEEELQTARLRVPFSAAVPVLERVRAPVRYTLRSADRVGVDALFVLDARLRSLVPGSEGWQGNRQWFDDEMRDEAFDPTAFLVAVDRDGSLVGLVRVWRNPDGPHLGMIGLLPEHQGTMLGAVMLCQALEAAAGWGHDSFTVDASPSNRAVYRVATRVGEVLVRRIRLTWRPE